MDKGLFEKFMEALGEFIKLFFGIQDPVKEEYIKYELNKIPSFGDKNDDVAEMQDRLNFILGISLVVDGDFGQKTKDAISRLQKEKGLAGSGVIGPKTLELLNFALKKEESHPGKPSGVIPWVTVLLGFKGKKETDPEFQEYMDTYWAKSGLPNFKGLVGSARAWCGVFVFMGLVVAGYKTPVNSFRAKAWDGYGHAISWKQDGVPRGAIIRINSSGDCTSASGNHVTTANGDCTAATLNKPNATIGALGGNQQNSVKVSIYKVSTICYVGFPSETILGEKVPKPEKILKDNNCSGTGSTNESTR